MKYRTVKEVIDFVRDLRADDTADSLLKLSLEFYCDYNLNGVLVRNMYSNYVSLSLKNDEVLTYLVDNIKVIVGDTVVIFKLSVKKPSSI